MTFYDSIMFYFIIASYCFSFCVSFFLVLLFTVLSLRNNSLKDWAIQHKFAMVFGASALMLMNPLSVIALFFPEVYYLRYVNMYLVTIGISSILFSFLVLVDSLRYPIGITSLPGRFYFWKALFGIVLLLLMIVLTTCALVMISSLRHTQNVRFIGDVSEAEIVTIYVLLGVVVVLTFSFAIWAFLKVFLLKKRLRKYPYLVCRFRHLARKPLVISCVVFILMTVIESVLPIILSSYTNAVALHFYSTMPVTTIWFLPTFTILIMYIFLPAKTSGHAIDNF